MSENFFKEIRELKDKGKTIRVISIDGRSYDGKISKSGEDYIEVSHEKGRTLIYLNNIISVSTIGEEMEYGGRELGDKKGKRDRDV